MTHQRLRFAGALLFGLSVLLAAACGRTLADIELSPPVPPSDAGADVAAVATVDAEDAEISSTSDGHAGDAADAADTSPASDAADATDASRASDAADATDAAGPSQLDPTFGDGGILTISERAFTDAGAYLSVHSMAARADGRIVFAGTNFVAPMIAQVLADGSGLDPTFGNGGMVLLPTVDGYGPIGVDNDAVVALQADGKILVGDMCSPPVYRNGATDICITRLGADGSIDTTFGDVVADGGAGARTGSTHMTTGGTETDGIGGLAIDSVGRILFAGTADDTSALVGRLGTDGTFDETFHGGAILRIGPSPVTLAAVAIGTQSTGRIVIASQAGQAGQATDHLVVAGLTTTGALDSSFGAGSSTAGTVAVAFGAGGKPYGMAVGADDSILVAGNCAATKDAGLQATTLAAAKLTPAGVLDTGFAVDGVFIAPLLPGTNLFAAGAVVVSLANSFYLGGSVVDPQSSTEAVLKLSGAGVPAASYGPNGLALTAPTNMSAIAAQNGKIVTGAIQYLTGGATEVVIERLAP